MEINTTSAVQNRTKTYSLIYDYGRMERELIRKKPSKRSSYSNNTLSSEFLKIQRGDLTIVLTVILGVLIMVTIPSLCVPHGFNSLWQFKTWLQFILYVLKMVISPFCMSSKWLEHEYYMVRN